MTIVLAVVISGIVALTLTPSLCAALLKHTPQQTTNPLAIRFNAWFHGLTNRYMGRTGRMIQRPKSWLAVFGVMVVLAVLLARHVPSGFVPTEDKGFFVIAVQLPDAATRQRTEAVVRQVEEMLRHEEAVAGFVELIGLDILSQSNQTNGAVLFVRLKPWDERTNTAQQIDAVVGRMNGALYGIREALAFAFNFPEIPGVGTTSGLELNLQARQGGDIRQFAALAQQFAQDANQLPEVQGVATFIRTGVPQVYVDVDREAAKVRGVSPVALYSTLQAMLSTFYINDFNMFGRTYRVQAEADAAFRQRPNTDLFAFIEKNLVGY